MNKEDWQSLYNSLEIAIPKDTPKAAEPTPVVLDEYEAATGFKLPLDYRAFIQVFGPGELGKTFRIKAPGYPTLGYPVDLGTFNSSFDALRTDPTQLELYERREQIKRLHFFATTDGGEAIAWDPNFYDREKQDYDYAIYIMLRGSNAPEFLAVSFKKFIFDICLGDGYCRFFGDVSHWDAEKMGSQRVFWPFIDSNH